MAKDRLLDLKVDVDRVELRGLNRLSGDARFAAAIALTKTAKVAEGVSRAKMRTVFDRPTPYTLNSLFTKPATKSDLVAFVGFREFASKGTPAAKYMFPEVFGGERGQKRSERALSARGLLPGRLFTAPGPGAEIDQFGNMRRGQMVKLLSHLRASRDGSQNRNASGKSRGRRKREQYFAIREGSHLKPGVYKRVGKRGFVPVLNYIEAPRYSPRFPFAETVAGVVRQTFADQYRIAYERALEGSRRRRA